MKYQQACFLHRHKQSNKVYLSPVIVSFFFQGMAFETMCLWTYWTSMFSPNGPSTKQSQVLCLCDCVDDIIWGRVIEDIPDFSPSPLVSSLVKHQSSEATLYVEFLKFFATYSLSGSGATSITTTTITTTTIIITLLLLLKHELTM